MTDLLALARGMLDGLEGVTPGPWFSDAEKSEDGNGNFDAYAVYSEAVNSYGKPASICDTHNSGVIEIHQEYDEDSCSVWDENGRRNMAHIARCSPDRIRTLSESVISLTEENENLREFKAEATEIMGVIKPLLGAPDKKKYPKLAQAMAARRLVEKEEDR